MPKRSNEFQRLVKSIYDAMAHVEGGRVTESATLKEPNGTPREVDILVESKLYGHDLKIAVECRGRSRKDDIAWIDGLVGKYKNLGVQKVIAVSRKGFSANALEKARENGIETRTLKECLATDWPSEFLKLGVGIFEVSFEPDSIVFELVPEINAALKLEPEIRNARGDITGTVRWMLQDCLHRNVLPRIKEFINKEFLPSCKVVADLNKRLEITMTVPTSGVFLRDTEETVFKLKKNDICGKRSHEAGAW